MNTFKSKEIVMRVAIIMGSDSDWPVLEPAGETLAAFGVKFEMAVASAHRTPELVRDFVLSAQARGAGVFIAAAGAAAHLPGVAASYTTLPVIGVPINATPLGGLDALLSMAQMPAGIPVACMAINGAKNAALLAVAILALSDESLAEKLAAYRRQMKEDVKAKSAKIEKRLAEKYLAAPEI
jgi:5-(carboxyamino)imidazole ribonucleotide mutase